MSTLKTNNVQLGQSLTASQNFTWYQPATPDGTVRLGNGNSGSVTDLVTVNSTGSVGIGTSSLSTDTFTVYKASGGPSVRVQDTSGLLRFVTSGGVNYIQSGTAATSGSSAPIVFGNIYGANEWMRLDSSGNLGLGVTPSASSVKTFEIGAVGIGLTNRASGKTTLLQNAYYNAGFKYAANGITTAIYEIDNGTHVWYTAPSGTAGNAISFTQAMTLDASGNLLVGNTAFVYGGKTLSYATSAYNTNTYNPLELGSASGATVNHQLQKTTVSTTATVILSTGLYASLVVVFGSDGTNRFIDLVLFGLGNGAVGVVSSFSVSGTPAARTYSQSSSTYRLAMASGTYTVQAYAMSMNG